MSRPSELLKKRGRLLEWRADLRIFLGAAVFAAAAFWVFDSSLESVLGRDGTFREQALDPPVTEMWERGFVALLMIVGGLYGWSVFRQRLAALRRIDRQTAELEQLYQQAPVGVMVVDRELRCLRVSDALAHQAGFTTEEMTGRLLRDLSAHLVRWLQEPVETILEKEHSSPPFEMPGCKRGAPDSDQHWVVRCHPLLMGEDIRAVSCIISDVSDTRAAERALVKSEQRFRDLADLMPQTLFEIDLAGKVVYTNRHGLESFGYTERDLMNGITIADLFVDEDSAELKKGIEKGKHHDKLVQQEYRAKRKGGGVFPAYINSSAILAGGKPSGYRGVILDMTEIKHTAAALRESEEQLRITINALGDAIFVVDMDFRIVLFNAPFQEWNLSLGIRPGEVGMSVTELYPFLPESVLDEYRHVFVSGEMLITEEESLVREKLITTESRKIPVWEGGGVARVITVIRDVTERKRAESELARHRDHLEEIVQERTEKLGRANVQLKKEIKNRRRAQQEVLRLNEELEGRVRARTAELEAAYEELKELDKMKDVFLSTISHEFRTPLTSIRSYSEALLGFDEETASEEANTRHDFLQIINGESERLSRLIDNVLDLSQIEAGGVLWNDEMVELRDVAERAARAAGAQLRPLGLEMAFEFDEEARPVFADSARIQQVVTNLLDNAIKFSPPGGRITVRTTALTGRRSGEAQSWVRVGVVDAGAGVAEKDREVIFERFSQVSSNALTDKPKGTGLGLPISREIVTHYRGNIWVESEPGQGSAFYFTLPCAEEWRTKQDGSLVVCDVTEEDWEAATPAPEKIHEKTLPPGPPVG